MELLSRAALPGAYEVLLLSVLSRHFGGHLAQHLKVGGAVDGRHAIDGIIHLVVLVAVRQGHGVVVLGERLQQGTGRRDNHFVLSARLLHIEDAVVHKVFRIGACITLDQTQFVGQLIGGVGAEGVDVNRGRRGGRLCGGSLSGRILLGRSGSLLGCDGRLLRSDGGVVLGDGAVLLLDGGIIAVDGRVCAVHIVVVGETAGCQLGVERQVEEHSERRTAHIVGTQPVAVIDAVVEVVIDSPVAHTPVTGQVMDPVAEVVPVMTIEMAGTVVMDMGPLTRGNMLGCTAIEMGMGRIPVALVTHPVAATAGAGPDTAAAGTAAGTDTTAAAVRHGGTVADAAARGRAGRAARRAAALAAGSHRGTGAGSGGPGCTAAAADRRGGLTLIVRTAGSRAAAGPGRGAAGNRTARAGTAAGIGAAAAGTASASALAAAGRTRRRG